MPKSKWATVPTTALAIVLSSCGGGGGGGGSGGGSVPKPPTGSAPTPSPSPSPSPSPTPSVATLPPAPFGITASQQFLPFGWQHQSNGVEPLSIQLVDFRWSASARTYELVLPDVGRGRLEYLFPSSANRLAFKLVAEDGSVVPVDVTVDDTQFFDPPYRSSGLLFWTTRAPAPARAGSAVFGLPTIASSVPRSGQVTYLAQGTASGDALVVFDFGAGRFTGYVRLAWSDAWGPYPPNRYDFNQTSFVVGTNAFEAHFSVPGAPFGGIIRGQFMGADAKELAIAWRGPILNPYTNEWVEQAGVWVARDCSNCQNAS
jgi:hypothetical protein